MISFHLLALHMSLKVRRSRAEHCGYRLVTSIGPRAVLSRLCWMASMTAPLRCRQWSRGSSVQSAASSHTAWQRRGPEVFKVRLRFISNYEKQQLPITQHNILMRSSAIRVPPNTSVMYLYRCLYLLLPAACAVSSFALASPGSNHSEYEELQALAKSAHSTALDVLRSQNGTGPCTSENIKTRIEW